jgi:hypothetical protein
VPDPRTRDVDLRPPALQGIETLGPGELSMEFDEDTVMEPAKVRISPTLEVTEVSGPGKRVLIKEQLQKPGQRYCVEAEARDSRGNTSSFMAEFYGFNGNVPRLLINEFTPRGSGNHPDMIELKVLSDGDIGGVVLLQGTPSSVEARFVFPSLPVRTGNFILVHCKSTGDPAEVNESSDITQSKGPGSSDTAWDFWMPDGKGLGGNNGVVSLYDRPGGVCLDGVLYSNRTAESDSTYRGFGGAALLAQAEELLHDGGWKAAGSRVTPEDAVNPEGSTSTRSICRSSRSADTDSAGDWHIVPSRKATFGAENCDDVYSAAISARAKELP